MKGQKFLTIAQLRYNLKQMPGVKSVGVEEVRSYPRSPNDEQKSRWLFEVLMDMGPNKVAISVSGIIFKKKVFIVELHSNEAASSEDLFDRILRATDPETDDTEHGCKPSKVLLINHRQRSLHPFFYLAQTASSHGKKLKKNFLLTAVANFAHTLTQDPGCLESRNGVGVFPPIVPESGESQQESAAATPPQGSPVLAQC